MTGRDHFVEAERLLAEASKYADGHVSATQRIAEATAHALLARAAAEPGQQVDREWCDTCDGSGYAPRRPKAAA